MPDEKQIAAPGPIQSDLQADFHDEAGLEMVAPEVAVDGATASALPYLVVGIGASAGGLNAYFDLIKNLTGDTGGLPKQRHGEVDVRRSISENSLFIGFP